jgi:hypothetical protein
MPTARETAYARLKATVIPADRADNCMPTSEELAIRRLDNGILAR